MEYTGTNISTGGIVTSSQTYQFDVAYPDLGPDQLLSHRGMLRILQEAAAIASDDRGYGMKDIPRTGVFWILSGWRLELLERCPWRETITVETWPRTMDGFISDRDFLAYRGKTLAARATSHWLLVNAATGRAARVTDAVRAAYDTDSRTLFDTPIPGNGKSPAGARMTFSTTAGLPKSPPHGGDHLPPPDPAGDAHPLPVRPVGGRTPPGGDSKRGGKDHLPRLCLVLLRFLGKGEIK